MAIPVKAIKAVNTTKAVFNRFELSPHGAPTYRVHIQGTSLMGCSHDHETLEEAKDCKAVVLKHYRGDKDVRIITALDKVVG